VKREDGRSDLAEGEVFSGAGGALLPVEEEFAVAVGEAGGGVDIEVDEGLVDPGGRSFQLDVVADGGLVDDEMGQDAAVGGSGARPFGAVLLIDESWVVAELMKDLGHRVGVGDRGFGFDADLVAGGIDWILLVGQTLVRDGAEAAVLANAEDLAAGAEVAGWSVVEGVVLEGAGCDEMKTECREEGLKSFWISDGDFELDLRVLHGWSIRLVVGAKLCNYFDFAAFFKRSRTARPRPSGLGRGQMIVATPRLSSSRRPAKRLRAREAGSSIEPQG